MTTLVVNRNRVLYGFSWCMLTLLVGSENLRAEDSCCAADECCPRQTLLQWSYGTSFSGGPDLEEPLVTDRPDFTESTVTVGRGVVQLELGYTYSYDDEAGERVSSNSYPESLLRVGVLAEWLEFRVGWNAADETVTSGGQTTRTSGTEDLSLGLKFALTPQEGILPEMAAIAEVSVPTGSDAFTAGEVLASGLLNYGWELNDWISTAGQTSFGRAIDGATGRPYLEMTQSWTVAYSLTDRLGAYTEWFALIPDGADTESTQHFANGGFSFLLTDDIQYDVFGGVGLNRAADDYFLGTGLSIRF